ncbi:DUF4041 domain-containing protein [Mycetocola manganoxydans]|uniref:DUF4041 domain-containing protein n=1 Tax=Mycetocola manganoxydans TaxID=699879 RepID=A0A3L6ZKG7_9MICO|nr:DUF4041 domain-containing protein [Mycetocola manganoxydans]
MFNPPPGWPQPPPGWQPPAGWSPDPSWPDPPPGWELWVPSVTPKEAAENSFVTSVSDDSPIGSSDDHGAADGDIDRTRGGDVSRRMALLEAENATLRAQLASTAPGTYVELNDAIVLQDVGIYRYHHPLESAAAYKDRLNHIESQTAELVKSGRAIVKSELFTFNNSLAQGRRMTEDLAKLMLRAYNAEADNSIRSLKAGNVLTARRRMDASRAAIARLGRLMEMHISDEFHALRLEEIELTSDWLVKKQEEREAQREERARLKEENRVAKELAEERANLDKERSHLLNALNALEQQGQSDPELVVRLALIDDAIAQNDFRAANIRAGYVYVISNEGAFGKNVVKIGLTRRLDPGDRIAELSGASVPFRFDTHTLYFSEDAVTLENELHRHFADRALNRANARKEFFFATPVEVKAVLLEKVGNLLEFTESADATEYRQSVALWPAGRP